MSQTFCYILKRFLAIQVLFFLLSGCSLLGIGGEKPEKSPEELMSEGMSDFRRGNYTEAVEAFQTLKDRYPYSTLALEAELKLADAHLKRKEFEEALEAYKEFERLHPKNPSIPYAIYQQGMCHYLRIGTIDRDNTSTKNALQ